MKTLTVGRGNFDAVAYAEDARLLVSLNSRRQVRFWDLATFRQRLWFRLPEPTWTEYRTLALWGDRLALKTNVWDIGPAWEYLRRQPAGDKPEVLWRAVELQESSPPHNRVLAAPDGALLAGVVTTYSPAYKTRVQVWDVDAS